MRSTLADANAFARLARLVGSGRVAAPPRRQDVSAETLAILLAAERHSVAPCLATPGPELVALTGNGQRNDIERAFAAGFDPHLVEPLNPALRH